MTSENSRSRKKRQLAAVVFADAVGYSAATQSDEEAAHGALMARLELLSDRLPEYHGEILNRTGDGVLALFDSVVEAVRYAVDMQTALTELNATQDGGLAMQFRFGVNFGDVIADGGQVYGDTVNIAARLEGAARADEVCITRSVYEQVRLRLDFTYEYLGPRSLKNIEEAVETYSAKPKQDTAVALPSLRPEQSQDDALLAQLFERPSVAVLPFHYLGSDIEQEFFADGLTEDIITNLSRFRGLSVIARSSAFVLKGQSQPVDDVARRFNVRYVVEGSLRHAGNRVRVRVDLSDGTESKTLWSERYDRDAEDIFSIQNDITSIATSAMAVQIEAAEHERLKTIAPPSLAAYGLVLQGQYHLYKYTREENIQARDFYAQGVDHDRNYARALAALSRTHNLDWRYSWTDEPDHSLDVAQRFAQDAVNADPSDARGQAELGYVRLYRKEHGASIDAYERAVALNPSDANIIMEFADTLAHSARADEAVELFQQAMRLNPYYPDDYLWGLAGAYFKLERYEDAMDSIQRMNNPAQGQRVLTASLALLGRIDEAKRRAELVRETQPGFSADKWAAIVPDIRPDDTQRFLEGLRLAGL
ncbi:MAG: adenylate/guanylate cyclase domain-containing protein [Alphaproteobacteria bacterium]|nr:adenylate/guanylate cyclase domain-containing protein [Alphaproteobacteria bacterium]MDP6813957.1 adenylate/guanylate cyclase domain-containing protein [Alphaproteobacteria bacterium]